MEIDNTEREKKLKEIFNKTKQRYQKLKESGKLNRHGKHTNPLNTFNLSLARDLLKMHLENGKTVIPIDLKNYWKTCNINLDFQHVKDKIRRYFEIVVLNDYIKDGQKDMEQIITIYGTKTTEILRKHFALGKHFILNVAQDSEDVFLNIDIRDLIKWLH